MEWRGAQPVLVQPGGIVPLNRNAALLLELCDGTRTLDDVVTQFTDLPGNGGLGDDARDFLEAARVRGWIVEV